jgi:hypothetical protein
MRRSLITTRSSCWCVQAGVLPKLLALLQSGIPDVVMAGAGCIGNLANGGKDICVSMLEFGVVEALGAAMETSNNRILEKCLGALRNLMVSSDRWVYPVFEPVFQCGCLGGGGGIIYSCAHASGATMPRQAC